ncbi:ABC-F family ATP-binding cassette domain-containing protein [Hujiaoplasma nucleasis]|uniref:ABC-F family ATP-binding cassette domain-containing protein n=1 Tax=Hujiaoplasma nucleasis TaxID=2725268 RepID=A0A7L6N332_9MOLU|nr:ABC-F family ATP-binding cassette domain-containing protein [Hujiaoplasma nucleasis]QLY39475.1 ABC-F family ATP-binding cassette domain-containing protein [Hujiaoplasma nucleasis]
MSLLRVNQVSKSFAGDLLFDRISLDINQNEKVALIGRNGTGKSTLFKIILKEISPDQGEVFIHGQTKIGYLSQNIIEDENHTLYEEVVTVFKEVIDLEKKLHEITQVMEKDHSERLMNHYARVEDEFQHKGGYDYLIKIDTLLSHFGFKKEQYNRQIKTFSGGEKTRIAFAKLLMIEPDILLLDEPTNHMDIEIIEWLEDYLKAYNKAVFVITHDKYFINKVCKKIIEIDQNTIETYHGNYDEYEEEKVKRYELLMKKYQKQQKEILHLQSFVDRFRYKATKAKSAQDRIKKLNRIDRIEAPSKSNARVHINFNTKRPTKINIIELKNLSIGYDQAILKNINFKMRGFDKVGIIGPNGSGKTTLIKTIMSMIEPIYGQVIFHKHMKIGYFDQNLSKFNPTLTLLETVHQYYPTKTLTEVRSDLARVMFVQEDAYKTISVLSGGELVKLHLLFLMLEEPDLLILDEPTNHLDIDTKNIIEDVFEDYEGPIIFISHDRYFINKVATKIISISNHIEVYHGNYTDYIGQKSINQTKEIKPVNKIKRVSIEQSLEKLEEEISHLETLIIDQKQKLFEEEIYSNIDKYDFENQLLLELENKLNEKYHELEILVKKEY